MSYPHKQTFSSSSSRKVEEVNGHKIVDEQDVVEIVDGKGYKLKKNVITGRVEYIPIELPDDDEEYEESPGALARSPEFNWGSTALQYQEKDEYDSENDEEYYNDEDLQEEEMY